MYVCMIVFWTGWSTSRWRLIAPPPWNWPRSIHHELYMRTIIDSTFTINRHFFKRVVDSYCCVRCYAQLRLRCLPDTSSSSLPSQTFDN